MYLASFRTVTSPHADTVMTSQRRWTERSSGRGEWFLAPYDAPAADRWAGDRLHVNDDAILLTASERVDDRLLLRTEHLVPTSCLDAVHATTDGTHPVLELRLTDGAVIGVRPRPDEIDVIAAVLRSAGRRVRPSP